MSFNYPSLITYLLQEAEGLPRASRKKYQEMLKGTVCCGTEDMFFMQLSWDYANHVDNLVSVLRHWNKGELVLPESDDLLWFRHIEKTD